MGDYSMFPKVVNVEKTSLSGKWGKNYYFLTELSRIFQETKKVTWQRIFFGDSLYHLFTAKAD